MYNQLEPEIKINKRLQWVDIARGVSLFAMFIYHLTWDLGYFQYISPNTATSIGWVIFARIIASSFLFLAGFSLFLAHQDHIRWKNFFNRFFIIVVIASFVTLVTYFIFPSHFIYFGILHQIALTSLVGLLFLRTPIILNIALFILIIIFFTFMKMNLINESGFLSIFQSSFFSWTGLNFHPQPSFDLVPFIPYFAAGLIGITAALILKYYDAFIYLKNSFKPLWLSQSIQFCGRHSLIIYVVHQPIIFGIVFLATYIIPPSTDYAKIEFIQECSISCQLNNDAEFCQKSCGCFYEGLKSKSLLSGFISGDIKIGDEEMQSVFDQCNISRLAQ